MRCREEGKGESPLQFSTENNQNDYLKVHGVGKKKPKPFWPEIKQEIINCERVEMFRLFKKTSRSGHRDIGDVENDVNAKHFSFNSSTNHLSSLPFFLLKQQCYCQYTTSTTSTTRFKTCFFFPRVLNGNTDHPRCNYVEQIGVCVKILLASVNILV